WKRRSLLLTVAERRRMSRQGSWVDHDFPRIAFWRRSLPWPTSSASDANRSLIQWGASGEEEELTRVLVGRIFGIKRRRGMWRTGARRRDLIVQPDSLAHEAF